MCHADFNITIEPNSWELIAVEGYENANYVSVGGVMGLNVNATSHTNNMCRSSQRKGFIRFNLQVKRAADFEYLSSKTYHSMDVQS